MGRKCHKQKIFHVLRRLDAADGLILLQVLVTKEMIRGKEVNSGDTVPQVSWSCRSIRDEDPSRVEPGGVPLSADTLMQAFPPDHVQRCRLVYERRRSSRRNTSLVDDQRVLAFPIDEVNVDDLIVDPHHLEDYGEALYTPAEVRAMFPND
ncbi:hypothetical protein Hanom_Chr12g01092771 [Helianthus anomalus]